MTKLFSRLRAFRADDHGASAIEFAMIASLLSIILLNIVDIASYMFHKMELTSAVRAGAQYRLVNDTATTAEIEAAVTNATNLTGLSVTVDTTTCSCSDGVMFVCGTSTCAASNVRYYLGIDAAYPHTWLFWPGTTTIVSDISIRTN